MDYLLTVGIGYGALVVVALIYGGFVRASTGSWGAAFRSALYMAVIGAFAYFALRFSVYSLFEAEVNVLRLNHPWVMMGVPAALELIIVALAYQNKWFWQKPTAMGVPEAAGSNYVWARLIPFVNDAAFYLSILAFGASVVIVVVSPGLFPFLVPMAVALFILGFFRVDERTAQKPRYENTELSALDILILIVILARDLILFSNTIPFVQLLGMVAAMYAGVPILIVYWAFLWLRSRGVAALPPAA